MPLRFVGVGILANASYGATFVAVGWLLAWDHHALNLVSTVLSTVVANELHRRFTFRGAPRASVQRSQTTGSMMALAGYAASSLTLSGWHVMSPAAGPTSSVAVVYATTALVGALSFLVMRRSLSGAVSVGHTDRSGHGVGMREVT